MTPEQAANAILNGQRVRLTVGTEPGDPALLVWVANDHVESRAVDGWSAGVEETVCFVGSSYLHTFLSDRAKLELVAP